MLAIAVAILSVGTFAFTAPGGAHGVVARAALHDGAGQQIGEVTFQVRNDRVVGQIEVRLPADSSRFHGFHLHANNDPTNGVGCVGPAFTSADGHWNPGGAGHGSHRGDLPPLLLGPDGRSRAEFDIGHFVPGELTGLAVIVHAGPDNLANVPTRYTAAGIPGPDAATLATGDAGGRYACGVIEPRGR
jgi:Cu-Zn family superoxide dismutase